METDEDTELIPCITARKDPQIIFEQISRAIQTDLPFEQHEADSFKKKNQEAFQEALAQLGHWRMKLLKAVHLPTAPQMLWKGAKYSYEESSETKELMTATILDLRFLKKYISYGLGPH